MMIDNIAQIGQTQTFPINTFSYQASSSGFLSHLVGQIKDVDNQLNVAATNLQSYALKGDISAHELMISLEKAKLSLQLSVEIRNRVLDAYQELSRLQI